MTRSEAAAATNEAEQILLVEDDPGLQSQMKWALAPYRVIVAGSRTEALRQFKAAGPFRVVILDLGLPPDENGATEGLKTLEEILIAAPKTKIIVASGHTDRTSAIKAVGKGAFDFFGKPVDIDVLKLIIERANRMHVLEEENNQLRELPNMNPRLVFASAKMANIQRMIERIGPSDVSVLIVGETGTGKEVVARALHDYSPRRAARFVAINCASIPENLLESELFGHERGAFTGAVKQTPGKFELANNGTLFLDEIGDMPGPLQAKLLRFLQERQFERVGGRVPINVNVRLICATNRPLEKMVQNGTFREDLYYRINEIRMDLPPLRERENDAIIVAQHFFNALKRTTYRDIRGISENALAVIARYEWPGNVRELENRMKRAVVMAEGRLITAEDLDLAHSADKVESLDLRAEVEKLERTLVQKALAISEGNVSKAAKLLCVSRPHLYNLMKGSGIHLSDEKVGE
ncbi:MAG TPA: PEP-CTERM-box response regulator transcription factor [Micropepsaceae bacterium]|nr:PEP-CTERM-box response regulator transcription factor [Micropepsaceae bacterium]